jgi:hypothetical protein
LPNNNRYQYLIALEQPVPAAEFGHQNGVGSGLAGEIGSRYDRGISVYIVAHECYIVNY